MGRNGPRRRLTDYSVIFVAHGTIGPGPWPPKARPQGLWAHLSEFDGDLHESVCNSAVFGVKVRFTAIFCGVGLV